jgi:hypothetical protein
MAKFGIAGALLLIAWLGLGVGDVAAVVTTLDVTADIDGRDDLIILPMASNAYTTILEFNDDPSASDALYQGQLTFTTSAVPESSSAVLLGTAFLVSAGHRRLIRMARCRGARCGATGPEAYPRVESAPGYALQLSQSAKRVGPRRGLSPDVRLWSCAAMPQ